MSQITTFLAVQAETADKYWNDFDNTDKRMIEWHKCPHCHRYLTYKGFANLKEARAYGICEPCDYAKLFWVFGEKTYKFLRKISARASAKTK